MSDYISRSSQEYAEICSYSNTHYQMSKTQQIEADLKQYKPHDKSSYFVSPNSKIQTAIDTMMQNHLYSSYDPKCLLRFDAVPTKEYSGHGNAYIPVYKMSYLQNLINNLESGSYHECLYKSSDMNVFFDFDFKELSPELIDVELFQYDLQQAFKSVLTTWGYTDKFQIKNHINNKNLGFHTHIKGFKINLMVLQFLVQKVVEEFEQYEDYYKGLIDTKVYKQFGSLRKHGFKYDPKTFKQINYYISESNNTEDYLIYHLIPNSTFITVPPFLIDEYYEFHNPQKQHSQQVESRLQSDAIVQVIQENAQKYDLEIQNIEYSARGILVYLNNEICPICKRSHEQISNKRLYCFERNGTIYLNCFQNNAKPKKEFKAIRITTNMSDKGSQKCIKDLMLIQKKIDIGEKWSDITSEYIRQAEISIQKNTIDHTPIELNFIDIETFFRRQMDIFFAYQMSTGKTKQCLKLIKRATELELSICHITSRKTFTDSNISRYNAMDYREHSGMFETTYLSHLMIQVEAIMRVDVSIEYPKVLVFDEFISLQQHMMGSEYMRTHVWQKLVDLIKNCKHLIVMDAYLNKDRILAMLSKLRGYDQGNRYIWKQGNQRPLEITSQVDHKRKENTTMRLQVGIPKESDLCDEILSNVMKSHKRNVKTAIYTTAKGFGYRLQQFLKISGLKVCYMNGDGDIQDFNDLVRIQLHKKFKTQIIQDPKRFNDYDVVIYTQTFGIGISLEENPDFQNLIAIADQFRVSGANEVSQSLFRFRNIHSIQIYSHGFNFNELLDTIPKAHSAVQKQNIFEAINPAVDSDVYQFQLHCIVERSIQKHQFNLKLVEYLLRMGTIVENIAYLEDSKIIKATSKKFKFGQFPILESDYNNIILKNNDQPYIIEQFDNKNKTLHLMDQLQSFDYSQCCHLYDQQDGWIVALNDHIKQKQNWYMNLMRFHSKAYQEVLNIRQFDDNTQLSECFGLYIEKNKSGLMPQQIQGQMREIYRIQQLLLLVENRSPSIEKDAEVLIREYFKDDRKLITLMNQNIQKAIVKTIFKYTPYTPYLYYYNSWQKDGKGRFINNKESLPLQQSLISVFDKKIIDFGDEDGAQLNNVIFIPDVDYIRLFIPNYEFLPDIKQIQRFTLFEEPLEDQMIKKAEKRKEQQKKYREEHKKEILESKKIYREEHKEDIRESKKIYREEHKEEIRESVNKYMKKYRNENK